jgi:serine protease Do
MPQESQRGASLGSGFVVSSNGYILTNNHVVERANRIRVKFNGDQTEYDAKVIGTDWQTDLAVIKIDRTNLIPVRMGNSDSIQVGDWAIAIGSPFGFQETVTAGIISAKSRDIPGDSTTFQHFLQTDAAINPGNSGGPLLNINGEVIGINTQIASRSGGYQGIGFAMPSNTAVKVYNQIIKTGKVTRGSIGISFQANTAQIRELLKAYGAKNGVFVSHVEPGGPAEKAGLREQDIITEINGQKIQTGNDLIDVVADTPIGQSIRIDYLRDGKPAQTEVTIADRSKVFPKEPGAPETSDDNGNGGGDEATQARFGISIQNLNDKLKQNMGVKENGVVVQSVEPGSFAEDMGLVQGDVITQLNRKPITSVDQFKSIQSQLHTGDAVALRVLRSAGGGRQGGGEWQTLYLAGTVPAAGQ